METVDVLGVVNRQHRGPPVRAVPLDVSDRETSAAQVIDDATQPLRTLREAAGYPMLEAAFGGEDAELDRIERRHRSGASRPRRLSFLR